MLKAFLAILPQLLKLANLLLAAAHDKGVFDAGHAAAVNEAHADLSATLARASAAATAQERRAAQDPTDAAFGPRDFRKD